MTTFTFGQKFYMTCVKRPIGFLGALMALVLLSPIFIATIILLHFANKGAGVFFTQDRPGKNENIFKALKFKTMTDERDAEGNLLPDVDRLTPVGKFVRSTSIDELPQLVNILKGDMAFIGPRPERKFYIDQIMEHDARYPYLYQIRPGVTSYATLYNGYTDTMEKMLRRLELDLYYLEHRSWWFDTKILVKTFINIVFGKKF